MEVIFEDSLSCCFDDSCAAWHPFTLQVSRSEELQSHELIIDFVGEQCYQIVLNARFCVIGSRDQGSRDQVTKGCGQESTESRVYFIATEDRIISLAGIAVQGFLKTILSRRCVPVVRTEDDSYDLDDVIYIYTDIGEIDPDESEHLLAITPSEICFISLHRSCVSIRIPLVKIKTRNKVDLTSVCLQVGRTKHGNRQYTIRSSSPDHIMSTIKLRLSYISSLIRSRQNTLESVSGDQGRPPPQVDVAEDSEIQYDELVEGHGTQDSDIYPYFDSFSYSSTSTDDDFYERLDESLVNVIYQDVELADRLPNRRTSYFNTLRRRSASYKEPTFISYIIGGTGALETGLAAKNLLLVPESNLEESGEYSQLFDPRFVEACDRGCDRGPIYDKLNRDS